MQQAQQDFCSYLTNSKCHVDKKHIMFLILAFDRGNKDWDKDPGDEIELSENTKNV